MRHLTWLALLLSIGCRPAAAQSDPAQSAAQPAAPPAVPTAGGGATGGVAGNGTAGAWSPQGCGAEPVRPVLDLGDRTKYNHSADVVNEYEGKAKTWDACVMKQASADMEAISTAAKARMAGINHEATQIQARVYAGFGEYTTQFKAAQERFEKEK